MYGEGVDVFEGDKGRNCYENVMYVSSADNKVRFERVYGEAVDRFGTRRRHAHTRRHAVPPMLS